ncbi:MAG: hypothetical protein ABIP48_00610, partial [Planctomycetota bacterium]
MKTRSSRRRGRAGSFRRSSRRHRPAHRFTHARRLRLESLEKRCLLSTFTVTSTSDSGLGSLRQAILDANANAGADVIDFNIGGGGTQSIQPLAALPTITDPVTLDASTQPGFAGTPLIELDGSLAGAGTSGLTITAGNSTVRGLVVNRFERSGVVIEGGAQNAIEGNYIGTDATGTAALGNGLYGVYIVWGAAYNRIGTNGDGVADAAERNLISGNARQGCYLVGNGHNVVAGNFIGTDVTGTSALANGEFGVVIFGDAQWNRIGTNGDGVGDAAERNLISANAKSGVLIGGSDATDNVVAGNFIGTDVTGTRALGNGSYGVEIVNAHSNLVGTDADGVADDAERNVISGNARDGILITASSANNVVAGNFIGTDVTGASALGNGHNGVHLLHDAFSNRIGTNGDGIGDAAERNVISGNSRSGVALYSMVDFGTRNNVVAGTYIGTDLTGTAALGNGLYGVNIDRGALSNRIGTDGDGVADAEERNLIAFNALAGVVVRGGDATENSIRANSIHSNGGLGIDLGPNGPTPNDPGDVDASPNHFQNFPVIAAAVVGASTRVIGTLNSTPVTEFTVDFYASATADPSGYGEGERWLGSTVVTTDASGNAGFDLFLASATTTGEVVTATATDPGGNTSEFSAAISVARPLGRIDFLELADLDLSAGDIWYSLETTRRAYLTFQASIGDGGNAQLTLY